MKSWYALVLLAAIGCGKEVKKEKEVIKETVVEHEAPKEEAKPQPLPPVEIPADDVLPDDEIAGDEYPQELPESEDPKPVPEDEVKQVLETLNFTYWGDKIVAAGKTILGIPYEIGGCRSSLKTCDCSGFSYQMIHVKNGLYDAVKMRASAQTQRSYLMSLQASGKTKVISTGVYDVTKLLPGDQCYLGNYPGNDKFVGHVWTYAGKNAAGRHLAMDSSPRYGTAVRYAEGWFLNKSYMRGCVRPLYK